MKLFKFYFAAGFLLLLSIIAPLVQVQAVSKVVVTNQKTEVGVELQKSSIDVIDEDKEKETIYTPDDPRPIRVLPDTGEIITSFMYVILGLSILLFLFGLLVNRLIENDVRWD